MKEHDFSLSRILMAKGFDISLISIFYIIILNTYSKVGLNLKNKKEIVFLVEKFH